MDGKADDDRLFGFGGRDSLLGDYLLSTDFSTDGDDELHGMDGRDQLIGFGGSDLLRGGHKSDFIDARDFRGPPGEDTILADGGTDSIWAADGYKDTIDCGGGDADMVLFDAGLDVVADNCEDLHP
jgi:hypothetical protein